MRQLLRTAVMEFEQKYISITHLKAGEPFETATS